MGEVIPMVLRKRLVELCGSGKTVAEASRILGVGYPGAAKLWRRYCAQGESALDIGYARCGRKSPYLDAIRDAISSAVQSNENLGAPIIRSRLLAQGCHDQVPHERTIQRWWKAKGHNKPRGRRPKQDSSYAAEPHHTWQIDAKEKVATADGQRHTYLSITDEATCTFLKGHVFPLGVFDEASQPYQGKEGTGTDDAG